MLCWSINQLFVAALMLCRSIMGPLIYGIVLFSLPGHSVTSNNKISRLATLPKNRLADVIFANKSDIPQHNTFYLIAKYFRFCVFTNQCSLSTIINSSFNIQGYVSVISLHLCFKAPLWWLRIKFWGNNISILIFCKIQNPCFSTHLMWYMFYNRVITTLKFDHRLWWHLVMQWHHAVIST